jgi:hypothetical protein
VPWFLVEEVVTPRCCAWPCVVATAEYVKHSETSGFHDMRLEYLAVHDGPLAYSATNLYVHIIAVIDDLKAPHC